jgi:hypothetical protein
MTALAKAIDLEGRFRIASEFFPGPRSPANLSTTAPRVLLSVSRAVLPD